MGAPISKPNSPLQDPPYGKSPFTSAYPTTLRAKFDPYLLVWVDANVSENKENLKMQEDLKSITGNLNTYDTLDRFSELLKRIDRQKIILIISGAFGRQLVPHIHHSPAIIAIYVYCFDVSRNISWAKDYPKIKGVLSSGNELMNVLRTRLAIVEETEDSDTLKTLRVNDSTPSADLEKKVFVASELMISILANPEYFPPADSFLDFIRFVERKSEGDKESLRLIRQFEETYQSKNALYYFLTTPILRRFLSKCLREEDIETLFYLRFLLKDIQHHLTEIIVRTVTCFKVQSLTVAQMEKIKANPGGLLVVPNFLFASTDESKSLLAAKKIDSRENVLFEIVVDDTPGMHSRAYLQDVAGLQSIPDDQQIMFMCGAMFEIGELKYEGSMWRLRLNAVNDDFVPLLKTTRDNLRREKDPTILCTLFADANQEEKARIFHQMLKTTSPRGTATIAKLSSQLSQTVQITSESQHFLIFNLNDRLSDLSRNLMKILTSRTKNMITIIDNKPIDFSKFPPKNLIIFTTRQAASSLKVNEAQATIHILENDEKYQDGSTDRFIFKLCDFVIQNYQREIKLCEKKDVSRVEEINQKIRELNQEISIVFQQSSRKRPAPKVIEDPIPILVWLKLDRVDTEKERNEIRKALQSYFQSEPVFFRETDFHTEIVTKEETNYFFVVIEDANSKCSMNDSKQFPNIKFIYRYGQQKSSDGNIRIYSSPDKLLCRIATDMMDHYRNLSNYYRSVKNVQKTREMLMNQKNLCSFLSNVCFAQKSRENC